MQGSDAGDAGDVRGPMLVMQGMPGMLAKFARMQRMLAGMYLQCFVKVRQRGIRSPSQGQGGGDVLGSKCLGRPACR